MVKPQPSNSCVTLICAIFSMKDRIVSEDITVKHCPTNIMLADLLLSHYTRELFIKFRNIIMGYKHTSTLPTSSSSHDERIEISEHEWGEKVNHYRNTCTPENQREIPNVGTSTSKGTDRQY
jgi:hypothetical protein